MCVERRGYGCGEFVKGLFRRDAIIVHDFLHKAAVARRRNCALAA